MAPAVGTVDVVAVEAVIEAESICADRARAEAMLAASIAAARGPRRALDADSRWSLRMKVLPAAGRTALAEARLSDDAGRVVSERALKDRATGSCVGLVRAIGAWAQLVLDAELVRAEAEAEEERAPEAEPAAAEPPTSEAPRPLEHGRVERDASSRALAEPEESPRHAVDVGTTGFLRTGAASSGGVLGVSPFVTIALTDKWIVRPSFLYGGSTSRVPRYALDGIDFSALGGRLDGCGRVPGKYIHQRRLEVDICIGGDILHVWSRAGAVTRGSLGPSGTLRAKLGYGVAVELRTMAGVAIDTSPIGPDESAPQFLTAFEVGGSMRFE